MLQVEKFVLKISIYILYMFMNIQYIQHNYDYRAVEKIFLVTNDEDLFECYFQDIPWSSGAVLEVFCMNFLKTQCFFVQNLCKRDFTICCHHLQISCSQCLVHRRIRCHSSSSHYRSDFHLHIKTNTLHVAIAFFNHTLIHADSLKIIRPDLPSKQPFQVLINGKKICWKFKITSLNGNNKSGNC